MARRARKPVQTSGKTARSPRTLAVDIGGTGIKMLLLDASGRPLGERAREPTPKPAKPKALLATVDRMLRKQPAHDRLSIGFPGVVRGGIVGTAPNLGNELWRGFDFGAELERLAGKPVRVINDCDLQGYGVIRGQGVELVLTLGTGLGSALFVNGHLLPNLELGHHPFHKGKTYEQRVSDAELARVGRKRWSVRVEGVIDTLERIFNYDLLWIGGGNAKRLRLAPRDNVRVFENVAGLGGGVRLWLDH
jgi:polyphosphate glucokinase